MHYDFSQIDETESFVTLPPGTYLCRVAEVREGLSRDGSTRWSLRLEVCDGEFVGRTAAWDGLTWSERGIRRVKTVLRALGIEVDGPVDIEARQLVDRRVFAEVREERWEDPNTGRSQLRLEVPYAGYRACTEGELQGVPGHSGEGGAASGDGADSFDPFAES